MEIISYLIFTYSKVFEINMIFYISLKMITWVWLRVVIRTLNSCVLDVCIYLGPDRVLWTTSRCSRSLQLV